MPIYEFICEECKKGFEKFVLSSRDISSVRCPVCGSENVKKMMSSFSCCGSGQSGLGQATCGPTRRFG